MPLCASFRVYFQGLENKGLVVLGSIPGVVARRYVLRQDT